jgi:hypothetical protein
MSPNPPPTPAPPTPAPPLQPFEAPTWAKRLWLTIQGISASHLVTAILVPSLIVFAAAWVKAGAPFDWASIKSDLHLGVISFVSLLIALPQRSPADHSRIAQGLLLRARPGSVPPPAHSVAP